MLIITTTTLYPPTLRLTAVVVHSCATTVELQGIMIGGVVGVQILMQKVLRYKRALIEHTYADAYI